MNEQTKTHLIDETERLIWHIRQAEKELNNPVLFLSVLSNLSSFVDYLEEGDDES